ncbi:thiol reductant ABC exporter subunit CydC [Cellulomonas denverensis]|uniref:Thiol reductant ABC exporter subunit CydC n=1 Tax=Cellulomonas denverensis TaxID=264297 RepID=A0A7X6KXZ2_9CELL|nr:thiol reductant ABC exporter subunit CydC [Cellulomonas denverensis]NKY24182.1 thiol reductant ABC exporter subunit CydC [Cellulomonas denverensis]GIG25360.1 thiol reductant ABC exporter subunit CydC [Cellulomonas denverensis]
MSATRTAPAAAAGTLTPAGRRQDPLWRAVALLDVDRRRFALAALLGTLALGCAVALAAVSAWLITRAAQMPPVLQLSVATVGVRAFGIGRGLFRYLDRLVSHDVALRGMATLRTTLYTRLAGGRPEATLSVRRGDLLARVGADVDAVGDVVVRGLLPATVALALGVGTVAAMSAFLPVAGAILAACLVLAGVVAPWLAQRAARATEERAADARGRMAAAALGLLDDAGPLAVQGRTGAELARLREADADLARATDAGAGPAAVAAALGNLAIGIAVLGALLTGIPALAAGQLAAVELAVIVLTPLAAFEATSVLPAAAIQVHRSRTAAQRLMALLDAADAPEDDAAARPAPVADPVDIPACGPVITARGLAVGWPGRAPVLTGLDLELRPGRSLAVVGPSGIGKTTLLLTLSGFLPPRGGELLLDGVPLTDTDPGARLARLSLTTEDAHVFETTVLENLRVARGDATPEEARAALVTAGLGDWLAGLPDGVDTALGADGRSVSGGERRRLLLARALLSPAPLLLIDEPAEHLDPGTADRLVADLLDQSEDTTRGVLVVTHRLAPLAAADEVLLLDRGTVAARGTHQQLLAADAQYREAHAAELDEGGNDEWPTT